MDDLHDPSEILSMLRKIASFLRSMSKGQSFSCFVLRHVPGSAEKLVKRFEDFMVKCIHEYKAMALRTSDITFKDRQQFLLITREIDLYLGRLFWGSFNNNRDLLSDEQWIHMQQIAVELTYILDLLKGEFYYGSKAYTCAD